MSATIQITGLDELIHGLKDAPRALEEEFGKAIKKSLTMVETEAVKVTPFATGLLRSTIGANGNSGYNWQKGLEGGVGTTLNYAVYVHEIESNVHPIGGPKFMVVGLDNARPFITAEFEAATHRVLSRLL